MAYKGALIMEDRERLNVFKRECRNYYLYESDIEMVKDKIKHTINRLEDVKSPVLDKIGSSPSPKEKDIIKLIELKNLYEAQLQYYEDKMKWVKEVTEEIPSPAYRALTWMTCVQGKNKNDITLRFDISAESAYQKRDKFLLQVLDDEKMQELQSIDDKKPPTLTSKIENFG